MATAGVEFTGKDTIKRKGIETTQVKSIQLLTGLHNGSKNTGNVNEYQWGMIYGRTYSFKVNAYTNGKPNDLKKIKWKFKYQSLSKDKWIIVNSTITGDSYSIEMNEKDMCGRTIHVMAYINDSENEGYLKTWFHNRFRWFDRKIVHDQIDDRVKEPWRVDQGTTSLCGIACIIYLLAKKDSKGYNKLAKQLFRTGEYKHNDYLIEPHKNALDMYDVNPYKDLDHPKLPEIDWITMALVRSKESSLFGKILYKGKKGQDGAAINWPWLMKPLGKKTVRL